MKQGDKVKCILPNEYLHLDNIYTVLDFNPNLFPPSNGGGVLLEEIKNAVYNGYFIAKRFLVLEDNTIPSSNSAEGAGATCRKCQTYNEYATPDNDGKTYICFSCKYWDTKGK